MIREHNDFHTEKENRNSSCSNSRPSRMYTKEQDSTKRKISVISSIMDANLFMMDGPAFKAFLLERDSLVTVLVQIREVSSFATVMRGSTRRILAEAWRHQHFQVMGWPHVPSVQSFDYESH